MYIVSLTYTQPLDAVDAHLEGHLAWLDRYFQDGTFMAAGRKNPRNGGVVLAQGVSREELDRILSEDPFQAVARYEVTTLEVTLTNAQLACLKGL
ncbi:MAG: YciI family protein [Yersiniaceae bacterium]|uniref:YCII-related domain-containing protein n=1 Tax=Chimaeribacter coloradensis TaxID=2060068 RepID=A0A2N5ECX5_9GAMM|nr:YciI family protein [Chimaeribacter coloradensis]MDU6410761.1 YciI family protein [Yersiniaceae bacterium]PLR40379.1 hypothetical protein CYR32_01160 [Chimaeribacter coloradensis]